MVKNQKKKIFVAPKQLYYEIKAMFSVYMWWYEQKPFLQTSYDFYTFEGRRSVSDNNLLDEIYKGIIYEIENDNPDLIVSTLVDAEEVVGSEKALFVPRQKYFDLVDVLRYKLGKGDLYRIPLLVLTDKENMKKRDYLKNTSFYILPDKLNKIVHGLDTSLLRIVNKLIDSKPNLCPYSGKAFGSNYFCQRPSNVKCENRKPISICNYHKV